MNSPQVGSVVRHTGWKFEDNPNYPCDVYVTSGQYLSNGRVSNFWSWRRVLENGSLAPEENGYGSFEKASQEYVTEIRVITK